MGHKVAWAMDSPSLQQLTVREEGEKNAERGPLMHLLSGEHDPAV